MTPNEKRQRQQLKEETWPERVIVGAAVGRAPKPASPPRFELGDLVVCRENPSSPMEVLAIFGSRALVRGGSHPTYSVSALHGTGMRVVRG